MEKTGNEKKNDLKLSESRNRTIDNCNKGSCKAASPSDKPRLTSVN